MLKNKKQKGFSTILIVVAVLVVIAGGVLVWQYLPGSVKQGLPADNEMADWETYSDDIAGYQIKYPSSYTTKISNCFVNKKDGQKLNDEKSINISDQVKLSVHICYFNGTASDLFQEDGFVPITIGGRSAFKKEFEIRGGGRGWYYIQKDNSSVIFIDANWAYSGIYPNTVADEDFNKRKQTIDQILSTFKFVEKELLTSCSGCNECKELYDVAIERKDENICKNIPVDIRYCSYSGNECFVFLSKLKDDISICKMADTRYDSSCDDYFQEQGKNLPPVIITHQEKKDWELYKNEDFSFEVGYPSIAKSTDTRTNKTISLETEVNPRWYGDDFVVRFVNLNISIKVEEQKQELPMRLWVQKYEECGLFFKPYGRDMQIAGVEGLQIEDAMTCPPGGGGKSGTVYLPKDSKIYSLSIGIGEGYSIDNLGEIFNQMLSTFKFID
ncbi:MAG: hypothetical protein HQ539_01890 [Parcubacteria group bacterium]|nr:hypothetical protein [Parcubacteria group bacterium]